MVRWSVSMRSLPVAEYNAYIFFSGLIFKISSFNNRNETNRSGMQYEAKSYHSVEHVC